MSLDQINDYGIGDVNLTSMMETLDRQRRKYQGVSLTNYDNNNEPQIAAGSLVEVGGALFKFESNESITGWGGIGNDSDVYIKLVPSGATATAAFVTAAPTWSTSKQGWYVGNDRYVGGLYKDSGGNYTIKWLYTSENNQEILQRDATRPILTKIVSLTFTDEAAQEAAHGLVVSKIRALTGVLPATVGRQVSEIGWGAASTDNVRLECASGNVTGAGYIIIFYAA